MLTTTETAALAEKASRWTVEREIHRGNLEAEKAGGRWLIKEDEARRWAAGYQPYAAQRKRSPA